MTFPMPRLTYRRGRRPLSAALVLLYFWAFVALGLTHTHGSVGTATRLHALELARASGPAQSMGRVPAPLGDDAPCAICAAAHAAPAAIAQPPAHAHTPLPTEDFVLWSPVLAPSRTPRISRSRAPPQV